MNSEEVKRALCILADCQSEVSGIGTGCASITVEIGGTNESGRVIHDALYIVNCPPKAINELQKAGYMLGMQNGKLYINYVGV